MAVKVKAWNEGKSMNQYISDLLQSKTKELNEASWTTVNTNPIIKIDVDRPKGAVGKPNGTPTQIPSVFSTKKISNGLCKVHGVPLDSRGKCLQKGCKYA